MPDNDQLHGLFGGTFDPIHGGHLAVAYAALQCADLGAITYLPAARPPHRRPPHAAAAHRLEMARIATAAEPRFSVCDLELKRRGRSYTIDTVHALQRQNPRRRYALILGLDALLGLENWHRWQALRLSAHIIAIARPGVQAPQPPAWWQAAEVESSAELHRARAGKILFSHTAPSPISATEVRARLSASEEVGDWLPRGVGDYIRAHGLYRAAA